MLGVENAFPANCNSRQMNMNLLSNETAFANYPVSMCSFLSHFTVFNF